MKKYFKIIAVMFIAILCMQSVTFPIQAATNHEYANITASDTHSSEDVTNDTTNGIGKLLLDSIGGFVYAIAKIVRDLVKNFTNFMFGVNEFPWEDLIVFNTLPYLDINFFNYENGSIFSQGGSTKIGQVVSSVYFSLVTLSITVLGIGVAVTAIKLAISTIAAEKAKYKEALYKCLYTVVMLFSVHILISFLFYLNETIVTGCSSMLTNLINSENLQTSIDELAESYMKSGQGNNIIDKNIEGNANWKFSDVVLHANPFLDALEGGMAIGNWITDNQNSNRDYLYGYKESLINQAGNEQKAIAQVLFTDKEYWYTRFGMYIDKNKDYHLADSDGWEWIAGSDPGFEAFQKRAKLAIDDVNAVYSWHHSDDPQKKANEYKDSMVIFKYTSKSREACYNKLVEGYNEVYNKEYKDKAVVARLAGIFDKYIEDISGDINYPSLIIYCILLIQSISLLVNYIKRIFFVLVLALLAPIVVIYDFFLGAL